MNFARQSYSSGGIEFQDFYFSFCKFIYKFVYDFYNSICTYY